MRAAKSFAPFARGRAKQHSNIPREELERAARLLPKSDLKSAILATLADREPTPREALAWAALLQLQKSTIG
jgi:hypothetical protein